MKSREELEIEMRGLKEMLQYAVHMAKAAKLVLRTTVPAKSRKTHTYKQVFALVEAVADEDGFAGPRVAALAHADGIAGAARIIAGLKKKGGDEWKAAIEAAVDALKKQIGQ